MPDFKPRSLTTGVTIRVSRHVTGGRGASACTTQPRTPGRTRFERINSQSCGYGHGRNAREATQAALIDLAAALGRHADPIWRR